jgi:predicted transcriptional regulator
MTVRRDPGTLEAEILGLLSRSSDPLSPGEVRSLLDDEIAYTTVTTVLTRLMAKGLIRRSGGGRGYVYEVAVDESAIVAERMHGDLRLAGNRTGALQHFVSELDDEEAAALRRLLRSRTPST